MNYNISGINKMILEVFTMFDTAKVEIKKEHQLLMVSKTTSSRRARAKGILHEMPNQLLL